MGATVARMVAPRNRSGRTLLAPLSFTLGLVLAAACSAGAPNSDASGRGLSDPDPASPSNTPPPAPAATPSGVPVTPQVDVTLGSVEGGGTPCVSEGKQAVAKPVDLFILLDQSGSMTLEGNRWQPVTDALKAFVSDPTLSGLGVGLQYFPRNATKVEDPVICEPGTYVTPEVPIGPLPQNNAAILASVDGHFFTAAEGRDPAHWGTPTKPALEGVLQHLRQWVAQNPERTPVVLLATDGQPSKFCAGNDIAGIAQVIASAAQAPNPIKTYVVGIGALESLDVLAQAGGTQRGAFIVDGTGSKTQEQLAAVLQEIRGLTLPCSYGIPTPASGQVDPSRVNVAFSEPQVTPVVFPQVQSVADCRAGESNWYYDSPGTPTEVRLCPHACNAINNRAGQVDIQFGCKTQTVLR